jgi:predicted acyltransferase
MKTESKVVLKERLYSLDTLRGFDMFWIIGGGTLMGKLAQATGWGWMDTVAHQMHHAHWAGFHFEDLIFPMFMFISGVAIPYALISKKEKGVPKFNLYKKVFKRMILLVVLGFVYNGMLRNGLDGMRYVSVLSQIGIAYFFTALIAINTNSIKTRIFWLAGIWAGIAALHFLVTVDGFGGGNFTPEGSINSWIDQNFLPGRMYDKTFDPEGWLCIVSAISVTLIGAIAGTVLRSKKYDSYRKLTILASAGAALVITALALSPVYPIIKKMWTVPFDMLTAGISFLLLALFYYIVDIKLWRNWILFFQVIGLNSITIYIGKRIIDFSHASGFLLGWTKFMGDWHGVILVTGYIALEWLLLYYLYKNKIFLKV